jgi:hypothetical protein
MPEYNRICELCGRGFTTTTMPRVLKKLMQEEIKLY